MTKERICLTIDEDILSSFDEACSIFERKHYVTLKRSGVVEKLMAKWIKDL